MPRAPHDRDRSHWIVFGALTRSVIDTAIVLDAIRGPMPGDASPLPEPSRPFTDAARSDPGRLRIAVSSAFPAGVRGRLAPEVRGALERTVDLLRELGHTVVERDVDFRPRDVPVILGLLFRAIHDFVGEVERPARLERRSRALARPGMLVSDRTRDRLLAAERRMAERVGRLFVEHDVLLTPVLSQPAVPTGLMEGRGATVTYLWATGWVPFNVLWNATGQPAASVPAGFSEDGSAARGPDRRASQRRGDAAVARRAVGNRPAVGGPPPAHVLRAATHGRGGPATRRRPSLPALPRRPLLVSSDSVARTDRASVAGCPLR